MASYLKAENQALRAELMTLRFIHKVQRIERLSNTKRKQQETRNNYNEVQSNLF